MTSARSARIKVIVLPRRTLRYAGAVYLPGSRLTITDDEFDSFFAIPPHLRPVAPAEQAVEVEDAIARGLPFPGYLPAADDDRVDVTSPTAAKRHAAAKRQGGRRASA